jgi:2-polyprenyl-6-methoxyphenol hydroxylase-like FAD-dependent oxidoreductase
MLAVRYVPRVGTSLEVPVLVVGGGPVGLLLAVGLRHGGVDCLVVEKHASTLDFPKGRRVTTRTVEILRQWGLEEVVADRSLAPEDSLFSFEGDTLLGDDYERRALPFDTVKPTSPTRELICSQEYLEPVLRERAMADADVRFSAEVVGFTQDEHGVTARVVTGGERVAIRARYMVAADGAQGRTRDALGIGRSGPGVLGHRVSILVGADLGARMASRASALYWLRAPPGSGRAPAGSLFIAVDNTDRWLMSVPYDPNVEPRESLTEGRCLELVRAGLGDDSVDVRYLGHRFWDPTALVADSYRAGRVFLAGDAAHVTTPEGGLGMNCGIADVHNLAWKLAGAITGWAGPALLDTYEPERRPHAVACVDASLGPARPPNPIDGLVLGHTFQSAAVIDDGTTEPKRRDLVGEYVPMARPGHRAPHLWLDPRTSTLDLFGSAFVALTDLAGKPALDRAVDRAAITGVPLSAHAVAAAGWHTLYGLGAGGVVLVRPDGYVAWRSSTPPKTPDLLASALRTGAGQADSRGALG